MSDTTQETTRTFGWSDMFVAPDEDPREDGGWEGEHATLAGSLRDRRLTFQLKCAGLDAEQMARRPIPPSNLSLLGLLRHLADVERAWFRRILAAEDAPARYPGEEAFEATDSDDASVAEAWDDWRAQVENSERFVDAATDMGVMSKSEQTRVALREVMVHMIEEYARHNGHADLLRERIDGRVGQ
ncbi:DinB family protein [Phytomonospora sp. NPDC050363]|uniref:DinB family protein n=1 Tax=Phytomonospora sp. NPDC050363 TaxID=3155642 RepID=UPI0033CD1302